MKKIIEKIKKLSLNEIILIVLLVISLVMVVISWNRITTQVKKSVNFFTTGAIEHKKDSVKK